MGCDLGLVPDAHHTHLIAVPSAEDGPRLSVPDFQQFFLPILQVLAHGNELRVKDITPLVCDKMGISAEDRLIKLQSGQTRVYDRTAWGITYLRQAKLIDTPKRGIVKINDEGKKVLAQKLDSIDMKFLEQYPGYIAFRNRQGTKTKTKDGDGEGEDGGENGHLTPDESIEKAYKAWRQALVDDVLETVINCTPDFFERLVVELLVAMGYGGSIEDAGKAVGKTADGGVDGRIKEDPLGLDEIVVQAKRWKADKQVSRPDIQSFVGSMEGFKAKKGVFITTSTFSQPAIEFVKHLERKVVLIDGSTLANYMIDLDIGVTEYRSYALKKIDSEYYELEDEAAVGS
jgi:restriction system protein